jgi:hypothetical protein
VDAAAFEVRQISPRPLDLVEDIVTLGVVGHGIHGGTGEDQVRVRMLKL